MAVKHGVQYPKKPRTFYYYRCLICVNSRREQLNLIN